MWQYADIPRSDVTPLLQSNLVVQSTTTLGQFNMWKNADIPQSDVHPPANWSFVEKTSVMQDPTQNELIFSDEVHT